VNNFFFPNVTLPASDHRRLARLAQARADQGDVDARFLLSEINRVSRCDPNDVVRALFSNPEVKGRKLLDDDDPGPSAA